MCLSSPRLQCPNCGNAVPATLQFHDDSGADPPLSPCAGLVDRSRTPTPRYRVLCLQCHLWSTVPAGRVPAPEPVAMGS